MEACFVFSPFFKVRGRNKMDSQWTLPSVMFVSDLIELETRVFVCKKLFQIYKTNGLQVP